MEELLTCNLVTYTYELLLGNILSGKWRTGESLPSRKHLADSIGVSEITIRAALQTLAVNGLISSVRGKEPVVIFNRENTEHENFYWNFISRKNATLLDTFHANTALFSPIMIHAALHCNHETIRNIQETYEKFKDAEGRDIIILSNKIWTDLLSTLDNPLLLSLYQQMIQYMGLFALVFQDVLLERFKKWSMEYMDIFFSGMELEDAGVMRRGMDQIYESDLFVEFLDDRQHEALQQSQPLDQIPFYWFIPSERVDIHTSITQLISKRIELGTYKVGDKLPSNKELEAEFNVSVKTVRSVVETLRQYGLIETGRGKVATIISREVDLAEMDFSEVSPKAFLSNLRTLLDTRHLLSLSCDTLIDEYRNSLGQQERPGQPLQEGDINSVMLLDHLITNIQSPSLRHIYRQMENVIIKGYHFWRLGQMTYVSEFQEIQENNVRLNIALQQRRWEDARHCFRRVTELQYSITRDFYLRSSSASTSLPPVCDCAR